LNLNFEFEYYFFVDMGRKTVFFFSFFLLTVFYEFEIFHIVLSGLEKI